MFRPTIAIAAAVLALALLATGCGSSDGDSAVNAAGYGGGRAVAPASVKTAKPAATTAAAALPAAQPLAVTVVDNAFKPATLHATVGQKITWTMRGGISHTVTASAGATFDSGALQPGRSFSWTPERAGTVAYRCVFHPGMTGRIVVE